MDETTLRQLLAKAERELRESERKAVVDLLLALPTRVAPIITLGGAAAAIIGGTAVLDVLHQGNSIGLGIKIVFIVGGITIVILLAVAVWLALAVLPPHLPTRFDPPVTQGSFADFALVSAKSGGGEQGDEQAAVDLFMAKVCNTQSKREVRLLSEARDRIDAAAWTLRIAFLVSVALVIGSLIVSAT